MGSERWPCLIWSRPAAWNARAWRTPKLFGNRRLIPRPSQGFALMRHPRLLLAFYCRFAIFSKRAYSFNRIAVTGAAGSKEPNPELSPSARWDAKYLVLHTVFGIGLTSVSNLPLGGAWSGSQCPSGICRAAPCVANHAADPSVRRPGEEQRRLRERMRHYWMLAGVWAIMLVGEYSYFMFKMLLPGSFSPMPAVVTGLCLSLVYEGGKERLW